jgi:uncharacterized protein
VALRAASTAKDSLINQIAALPYRTDAASPANPLRIMLITSRETKRWVLPKGNLIKGLSAHQAAEHEAFEEAGITGVISQTPIGIYPYFKRIPNQAAVPMEVTVFPLLVMDQADDWPERQERETSWFSQADAAAAVEEAELAALILSFRTP